MKFAIVALAIVAVCSARPETGDQATTFDLEKLIEQTQAWGKKIGEDLGLTNIDSKKITETLNQNINALAENTQVYIDKLKTEAKAHEGEVNSAIKTVQDKLSEAVEKLQKTAGPEATKKADEIQAGFKSGYETVAKEIKTLLESPENKQLGDNFKTYTKNVLKSLSDIGEDVDKQLKAAIAQHEKSH